MEAPDQLYSARLPRLKAATIGPGSPKDGGTDGEMVFEVARASKVLGSGLPVFIDTRLTEAFIGMPIIFGEIEIVLNERSADVRVITDAVAMDDGIYQRQRAQGKDQQCVGSDENDPPGPVGVSLRAVKTLGPDLPQRNPPPKLLPVCLLLQGSVTTGNQSRGCEAITPRFWI